MKSFAAKDVTYSDGQRNREPIPAEIQESGFKPPVKLPDGLIELGDFLAANHLNTIFYDLYSQISTVNQVVEKGGNTQNGYRIYSNGDIEQWGRATPGTDGAVTITYPKKIPSSTWDLQVTQLRSSTDAALHVTAVVDTTQVTGFTTRTYYIPAAGGAPSASQNSFLWRSYYHA